MALSIIDVAERDIGKSLMIYLPVKEVLSQ